MNKAFKRLLTLLLCAFLYCEVVGATTFYVNGQEDLPDANPGDGEALAANGKVTLRAAIEEANATPGEHTIVFSSAIAQNRPQIGTVYIENTLVVNGELRVVLGESVNSVNIVARGDTEFRAIKVEEGGRFYIDGRKPGKEQGLIRFQSEGPSSPLRANRGTGIYASLHSEVTVIHCVFADMRAQQAGGGIYVDRAILRIDRVSFSNVVAESDGGAIYNNFGRVEMSGIAGGRAKQNGGMLFNNKGIVVIKNFDSSSFTTELRGGVAELNGGKIYSYGGIIDAAMATIESGTAVRGGAFFLSGGAEMHLDKSSIRGHDANVDGGAIFVDDGIVTFSQCALSDNTAALSGSAVYMKYGQAMFLNSTVIENIVISSEIKKQTPMSGGAVFVYPDAEFAAVHIGNTIIAKNYEVGSALTSDITGLVVSLGHNLIGVSDNVVGLIASDFMGSADHPLDPRMEFAPNINFVPRYLYLPLPGSPAIDAGDNSLFAHPDFVGSACHDARGSDFPRIRNAIVDIGAIEVQQGAEAPPCGGHSADREDTGRIDLGDLLRVIQFYNADGYHCDPDGEDGYAPGPNTSAQDCAPHSSDYNPQDWRINLSELLRLIQFFNSGGYHACPDTASEDGFCVGAGRGTV
jgi:hypothetical protein